MIVLGDRVKIIAGGDVGKVIRTFSYTLGMSERLFLIQLDNPDRFGCLLATAWELEVEMLNPVERSLPS